MKVNLSLKLELELKELTSDYMIFAIFNGRSLYKLQYYDYEYVWFSLNGAQHSLYETGNDIASACEALKGYGDFKEIQAFQNIKEFYEWLGEEYLK